MPDNEFYPKDEAKRLSFWGRQIEYAKGFYDPYWAASDQIEFLYDNLATTPRESNIDEGYLDEEGRIKANSIYAWVDQSISNILDRDPVFAATPESVSAIKRAPVVKRVTNYWYKETNQFQHDRRCLLDAFLGSYAVKRIGWSSRLANKRIVSVSDLTAFVLEDPEEENLFLAAGEPTHVDPSQDHEAHIKKHRELLDDTTVSDGFKEEIVLPHIKEHETLQNLGQADQSTDVQWEAPYGRRWQRRDFLVDPNAQVGLSDAAWIAFRCKVPLYRLRSDPNYRNIDDL